MDRTAPIGYPVRAPPRAGPLVSWCEYAGLLQKGLFPNTPAVTVDGYVRRWPQC